MSRDRLLDLLDATVGSSSHIAASVALVCAPAGSGKTTLLAEWARPSPGRSDPPPVAWATILEEDNTPAALHSTLVKALVGTGIPQIQQICNDLPNPSPALPLPVVDALAHWDRPLCLVLDDAHLLHDADALGDLETFLRTRPHTLRIVVCGRFEPPLAFQKLRLDGRVLDLAFEDLAFTTDEAAIMLAEHDVHLGPEDLEALMKRTEGWAAGLRLAGMSLSGHPDPTALIENFTGCRRAVADYLIEQVLAGQTADVREFLIKTSVPTVFTAALAEQLTGCTEAHTIIDALEHRNFLITRIEGSPIRFRYHPLLRSYLRAEIELLGSRAVAELEHVAARWYAEFGDALLSLEHGIAAGNTSDVVAVLSESGLALVLDGHGQAVERLLVGAPATIRDQPISRLVRAAAHLHDDNPTVAASMLAGLDSRSQPPESPDRTTLLADAVRLQVAIHTGRAESVLTPTPAVDTPLSGDPFLDSFLSLQRGRGHLHLGRLDAADEHLRYAHEHARQIASARTLVPTSNALAAVALCRGMLTEARATVVETRSVTAEIPIGSLDHHRALQLEAMCHYLRNDVTAAFELASTSAATLRDSPSPLAHESTIAAALFGIDLAEDRRTAVAALHTISTTGRSAVRPPGLVTVGLPSVQFAYLHIGETTWARELVVTASKALGPIGDIALLEAILCVCTNHLERARTILRPVLDGELPCAAATNHVTAWLLEAEIARRRSHDARAHDALLEALRLAEPETVVRPFHDMAQATRELLSANHGRFGSQSTFADGIWASLPRNAHTSAEKLTRRELELLAELPTWRTAEEIAADLCVSINTVKTHLRGIYRKLGVTTRRDAVAAAHTHGLL
ncbi:LuxR C-terminal-related transcriptional regulator [Prescottella defluvii]|uniref:LuxR C-terminal-related transcriptional regulator n=1 Tax=Prescottella defluvii TaxID=1323361 RepID=UPI000A59B1B9|nr:LuxR C-terminal-related transcriptional regulator [Prescottella defluvii]